MNYDTDAHASTASKPITIDITPTWGEWGNIYSRFAESGETRVVKGLHPDYAKAMAAAQAMNSIYATLTPEQRLVVDATMKQELAKQQR